MKSIFSGAVAGNLLLASKLCLIHITAFFSLTTSHEQG